MDCRIQKARFLSSKNGRFKPIPRAIGSAGDWIFGASDTRLGVSARRSRVALSVAIGADIGQRSVKPKGKAQVLIAAPEPATGVRQLRIARPRIQMKLIAPLFAALLVAGCHASEKTAPDNNVEAAAAPILSTPDAVDDHSFAKPLEARVKHVALDLNVDFDAKRIGGTATLDIDRKPDAKQIILDDKGLEIEGIADGSGQELPFNVGATDPNLGAPLEVTLRPDTQRLVIRYKSAPEAGALQWLTPAQTAGKKLPFLFSQGESIENRSWIPTQDSPGIRQSWEATIHVPAGMTAVMSAPKSAEPITQGGESVFSFRMNHNVAPYMIAIAVGDLTFRSLGSRTGVWAEPATIDAAARELSDTEKMVSAAEKLYGPYKWGRYDVLVLPPSFPLGGMENPTL